VIRLFDIDDTDANDDAELAAAIADVTFLN
jgi:hypothetical protein